MENRLELPEGADMYHAAQNLNSIQEGMSKAVADQLKSERLKIDLITNMSHDLKTPLSIAQSFTQICGGTFAVNIDGDLFKVELHFPMATG